MKGENTFTCKGIIRIRTSQKGPASRHFVNIPKDVGEKIQEIVKQRPKKRGWKSVKVEVHIGFVKRTTSIFPDKEIGSYILPLKKEVRKELRIGEGDEISFILTLI